MKHFALIGSILCFLVLVFGNATFAQERGQYLPGFRGLNSSEQPPPGFTYANYFFWYPAGRLNDSNGNEVGSVDIDLLADVNLLAYTPKKQFLGGTYTASAAISIQNVSIGLENVGAGLSTGAGLGDLYVEPFSVNWKLKKGKIRTAYGIMIPSGRWEEGASNNLSTDYWGHQFAFGGTYNPDKAGLWQINGHSVWEVHHRKQHEDVKVGNNVTFEYSVGKTFVKNQGKQLLQVGVVGYSQFQLTLDNGTDVLPFNQNAKDRVHALGGEFGVILPAKKFNFLVRVLPEYGARSRTQGVTVVFAVGKSF